VQAHGRAGAQGIDLSVFFSALIHLPKSHFILVLFSARVPLRSRSLLQALFRRRAKLLTQMETKTFGHKDVR
jgi:hypothetical protein